MAGTKNWMKITEQAMNLESESLLGQVGAKKVGEEAKRCLIGDPCGLPFLEFHNFFLQFCMVWLVYCHKSAERLKHLATESKAYSKAHFCNKIISVLSRFICMLLFCVTGFSEMIIFCVTFLTRIHGRQRW